jgi:ribosome biogenesis GTPase
MKQGMVMKSTGNWYDILSEDGNMIQARMGGKIRLDELKTTNPVAVGDQVELTMETNHDYIIRQIMPRTNYVVRQSPRKKHNLHLIASNVDHALLIVTVIEPNLKMGFIDRFLLMTEPYNIPVTIVFNKSDLYKAKENKIYDRVHHIYTKIGYAVVKTSTMTREGLDTIKEILTDKKVLISGQSGVGKSSLINAIVPGYEIRVGDISDHSGKGQHTTTFAEMHKWQANSFIIDTPGIKTLSFNNLEVMDVAHNFREFFLVSPDCKFNDCTHRNEPNCAVKKAVENGEINELRYNNYLQIIDDIESQNYWELHNDY